MQGSCALIIDASAKKKPVLGILKFFKTGMLSHNRGFPETVTQLEVFKNFQS